MPKLDIFLSGEISVWNEPEWGLFSTQHLIDQINAGPDDIDEICLIINSPGGDVVEGFAMFDFLRATGKKITTKGVGRVASIATVVFLAGDQRLIAENTEFMIHNPWTLAEGDADELQEHVDELREIENRIAEFYADKIGAQVDDLLALMSEETTFTSQQAIDMGFATAALEPQNKAAIKSRKLLTGEVACKANINLNSNMSKPKKPTISDRISSMVAKMKGQAKALDVTLEGGDVIQVETGDREEIQVGDAVTVGGQPVEDGNWTLQDGRTITTVDGAITEIAEAEGGGGDDDDNQALAELVANAVTEAMAPVTEFIEAQNSVNESQEAVNAQLTEALELIGSNGFQASDGDKNRPKNYVNKTIKAKPKTEEQLNDEAVANVDKPLSELVEAQKKTQKA